MGKWGCLPCFVLGSMPPGARLGKLSGKAVLHPERMPPGARLGRSMGGCLLVAKTYAARCGWEEQRVYGFHEELRMCRHVRG